MAFWPVGQHGCGMAVAGVRFAPDGVAQYRWPMFSDGSLHGVGFWRMAVGVLAPVSDAFVLITFHEVWGECRHFLPATGPYWLHQCVKLKLIKSSRLPGAGFDCDLRGCRCRRGVGCRRGASAFGLQTVCRNGVSLEVRAAQVAWPPCAQAAAADRQCATFCCMTFS